MHIPWLTNFIVLAQEGGEPAPAAGGGSLLESFFPIIMIFVIFWFLIIRPQSKKRKELARKVQAARKGDNVLTHGGIYGKIVKEIDEDVVVLEVDKHSKTRIQFTRTAILDIVDSTAVQDASEPEETTTGEAEAEVEAPPIPGS